MGNQKFGFKVNNKIINFNKYSAIWIRRWFSYSNVDEMSLNCKSEFISGLDELNQHISLEVKTLRLFFHSMLQNNKNAINGNNVFELNKMEVLYHAQKVGLLIPKTFIITSLKTLKKVFNSNPNKKFITKPLSNCSSFKIENETFMEYTTEMDLLNIESKKFAPSLLQEKIEKLFEIRTFFIGNSYFSMAIFSQENPKTAIDFRKYDNIFPNRNCPYNLPESIKKKLIKLNKILGLKTGSIDLIKSTSGEFYFLEINPEGQYGMTSVPCNYRLDEKISKYLSSYNK